MNVTIQNNINKVTIIDNNNINVTVSNAPSIKVAVVNTVSNSVTNVNWGNIIGDITNQTDLQTALNLKLNTTTAASTYIPYTGANSDADLGNNTFSAKSILVTGTNGNGHIHLKHQASDAASTGSSTVLFANVNGDIKYKNDGNFYTTFVTSSNTADRAYTFQNKSYTIADNADLANYTPTTRTISTTAPLSGGGDLSANRTLTIAKATTAVDGYLAAADFITFNNKQNALTLTTTGSSGAATLIGSTLNIPQYSGGGTPAGSNTQLQYNNAGAFGGISRVITDGSDISFNGSTSGATKLVATAIAGTTTLTLPAATDTLVGKSTTDVLTNKDLSSGTNTFPTFNQNTTGSAATLTTGRTIGITGDLTYTSPTFNGSANVTAAGTLATVNSNVGSFGSATQTGTFTVNAKGLTTAAGNVTITPAVSSITGLGTGIATALAVNVGSAGAPVVSGGALGTPSSGVATNLTGMAAGLTSGITNALKSATTTVDVSAATAPTSGQVLTATSDTTATWQTPSGGSSITLKTNGTNNGSQSILNLASGTGITLADNGSGQVTITNSGAGASPTVSLLAQSNAAVSVTGTTTETALATYTMPANTLTANGTLRINTLWSCNSNANTKTARVRFGGTGGTVYLTDTFANRLEGRGICDIRANNSTSAQKGYNAVSFSLGAYTTGSLALTTSTVNTTSNVDIVFSGQLAAGTDSLVLEGYTIELIQ